MIRKHFRLKRIVLGLAVAAVLAPAALAKPVLLVTPQQADAMRWQAMADFYKDRQPGITAAGAAIANQRHSAYPVPTESTITPLQADGLRWTAMAKFYKDRQPGVTAAGTAIANQKHRAYPVPATVASTTGSSNGFNWGDAGIGASVVFVAGLLLLTAVGLGRRHRSRDLASV
jgi:hypothetical protein